jgi:hypothetical protein
MFSLFKKKRKRLSHDASHRRLLLSGKIASRQVRLLEHLQDLASAEFSVTSQWGEDGIVEWLCHWLPEIPRSFIEIGVGDYTEANTRFLLENRGWRGLIVDSNSEQIDQVRTQDVFWRHDLHALAAFVTAENINELIARAGVFGEVGLLSLDIDGNDYWVLDKIDVVNPAILIVEINTSFGDRHALTIPYTPLFNRLKVHSSGQYFGASIRAMIRLAAYKGFRFIGTTSSGVNAFFVRDDLSEPVLKRIGEIRAYAGRHRDSRDRNGSLTFMSPERCADLARELPVVNTESGATESLESFFPLYSTMWLDRGSATIAG